MSYHVPSHQPGPSHQGEGGFRQQSQSYFDAEI